MREHRRDKGRLEDIKLYANNVKTIIDGVTFDEFVSDIRIYYSVMKNIEVIGEAANMLTRDFRVVYDELPWQQIIKMRNILVHGYAQVSDVDLWVTATEDIPVLLQQIENYLSVILWEDWEKQMDSPVEDMDNALYQKAIQSAMAMKSDGMVLEQISKYTGLPLETVKNL